MKRTAKHNRLRLAAAAALALPVLVFAACGPLAGHTVVIAGSTSVQPYAEILEEAYARLHADSEIDVQGGGSSAGITAAESGAADIGMSSRALKESESHLWSVEIAKDGLAVIVHPSNLVADLTLEEIRAVYTQEITNWSQLGGRDAKIHVITREDGSGSRSAFEDLAMGGHEISPRAIVQASNGAVRQLVSDDRNAIGFISLGLVEEGEKPVKALRLQGVAATRENVIHGTYALFRPFLFVAREKPDGLAMDFIEFILSPEGRRILTAEGLVTEAPTATEPTAAVPDTVPITAEATTTVPDTTPIIYPNSVVAALFQRLEGCWNDHYEYPGFRQFMYQDGKPSVFGGVWDGEADATGTLTGGESTGEGIAALYFWYPAMDNALTGQAPERTETMWIDFNGIDDGTIRIKRETYWGTRDWEDYTFSGATMEEAYAKRNEDLRQRMESER